MTGEYEKERNARERTLCFSLNSISYPKVMRAFVTGTTGLLGSNLTRALLQAGYEVRGLVRSQEKATRVFKDTPGVEFVTGDMNNIAGFAPSRTGFRNFAFRWASNSALPGCRRIRTARWWRL